MTDQKARAGTKVWTAQPFTQPSWSDISVMHLSTNKLGLPIFHNLTCYTYTQARVSEYGYLKSLKPATKHRNEETIWDLTVKWPPPVCKSGFRVGGDQGPLLVDSSGRSHYYCCCCCYFPRLFTPAFFCLLKKGLLCKSKGNTFKSWFSIEILRPEFLLTCIVLVCPAMSVVQPSRYGLCLLRTF